ncbi:MAG TPA: hypothetical protein DD640_09820 [Clostridiales bacterium]|nr:hypothetical protein [Clostridiales bacterium]
MRPKTILCLLLMLAMLFSIAACTKKPAETTAASTTQTTKEQETTATTEPTSPYPTYLNLDAYYPLVNEGEDITIKVATTQADGYGTSNPDDYWFFAWIQQKMNLTFEIEMIQGSAWAERKPLMFAGGDLPDLMLCMGLTTSDLVTYGESNKQLLEWSPYVNEELTPELSAWFEYYPKLRASVSCAGGGLYSLPNSARPSDLGGTAARYFINSTWLQEAGIDAPGTLDEFIDMLRAFKELYPDSIPMGGGYGSDSTATASSAPNPCYAIFNALGYITNDPYGLSPAIREDKVVIPAADVNYREFLETMKTLYDEELVSKDLFTTDLTQFNALALEDKFGAMGYVPYLCLPETWGEWESLSPLTSDISSTKQWYNSDFFSTGHYCISADTKFPELLVRLGSWFFSDDGNVFAWGGPQAGSDETLGMCGGWFIDKDKLFRQQDVLDGKYPNNWEYYLNECYPNGGFAGIGNTSGFSLENQETFYNIKWERGGYPEYARPLITTNGDNFFRISQLEKLSDYVTAGYPTKVFFDAETNNRISDLATVINSYVRAETAKFITGTRSLNEFDSYLTELENLGMSEYLKYYVDYYEAYKAKLG